MKKITYIDYETFEKTEQDFSDFQMELAENIKGHIASKYDLDKLTDILSNKNGDKLIIGLIKPRMADEPNAEIYRITIEKVKRDE